MILSLCWGHQRIYEEIRDHNFAKQIVPKIIVRQLALCIGDAWVVEDILATNTRVDLLDGILFA